MLIVRCMGSNDLRASGRRISPSRTSGEREEESIHVTGVICLDTTMTLSCYDKGNSAAFRLSRSRSTSLHLRHVITQWSVCYYPRTHFFFLPSGRFSVDPFARWVRTSETVTEGRVRWRRRGDDADCCLRSSRWRFFARFNMEAQCSAGDSWRCMLFCRRSDYRNG